MKKKLPSRQYASYIQSVGWHAVREEYFLSDCPQECWACGRGREPGFHLHHRTYERLGCERLSDLVLLCEKDHQAVHELHRPRTNLWIITNKYIRDERKRLGLKPLREVEPIKRASRSAVKSKSKKSKGPLWRWSRSPRDMVGTCQLCHGEWYPGGDVVIDRRTGRARHYSCHKQASPR